MRTIEIKLYKLSELESDSQKRAHEKWLKSFQYPWHEENRQSLEAFEKVFPINVRRWSYGNNGSGVSFNVLGDIDNLSGSRLATYLWNNYSSEVFQKKQYWICNGHKNAVGLGAKRRDSKIQLEVKSLTGFHMDLYLMKPIADFMRKPKEGVTFEDLVTDSMNAWVQACEDDIDFLQSEQIFKEESEANDLEYTEDGDLH